MSKAIETECVKAFSAVVFDCDGVMFDSRQANINFYNHLLAHFGLPLLREEQVAYIHMATADESIRYVSKAPPAWNKRWPTVSRWTTPPLSGTWSWSRD